MGKRDLLERIPESLKRFVDPSLPEDMRLMSAQGVIPVSSGDMALVLYCLTLDPNDRISKEAEKSLLSFPEAVMTGVISDTSAPSELLDYIGTHTTSEALLQKIILNPSTDDTTIARLAGTVHSGSLIELIANNQMRILRSAPIVEALSRNPSASRSTLDRVISFLRLYLEKKGEIPQFLEEDKLILDSSSERSDDARLETEDARGANEPSTSKEVEESFLDGVYFTEDFTEDYEADIGEKKRENLLFSIKRMKVAERIKLAMVGNMEARKILVRDPNLFVSSSVLRNSRLNETEVVHIAQSKVVEDQLLREIAETRRWMRVYQVKVSLVHNPKTPVHISLNYIKHLRNRDLKALSQNREVPGVIAMTAKRMIIEKREKPD